MYIHPIHPVLSVAVDPGMTQNMDMTAMYKIFISNYIMNFRKWY